MAWEARSGWKLNVTIYSNENYNRLNGLGSPFGMETRVGPVQAVNRIGLNGLGSPFGMETRRCTTVALVERKEQASPPGSPTKQAATSSELAEPLPPAPRRQ